MGAGLMIGERLVVAVFLDEDETSTEGYPYDPS